MTVLNPEETMVGAANGPGICDRPRGHRPHPTTSTRTLLTRGSHSVTPATTV